MAATKTKLKAEKRAAKEKKAKEAKEKKAAVAARKPNAQAKKTEKLILLTEACAWKAALKVESIRTQLAEVMAQGVMTPSTKISGAHVPKKSKGVSGQGTLSSPLSASFAHLSPQQKVASPKKRTMINSPLRSSGGLSSSYGSYSTMNSVEYPNNVPATGGMFLAPPPTATGRSVWALMKGGRQYRTPAHGSSPHRGQGSQRSNTDKDDSPFWQSGAIPHLLLLSLGSLPVGLFSMVGLSPAQASPHLRRYMGRYPPRAAGAPSLALIMVPVQMPLRKSPTKILRKACGGSGHLLVGPIEDLWRRTEMPASHV
jgi:hypothetical protein